MKKLTVLKVTLLLLFLISFQGTTPAQFTIRYAFLKGNNISSMFYNTGIFNQDLRSSNSPGFEWPKSTGLNAIFTTGLSLAAYVRGSDGVLRLGESMASYKGEWATGYVLNGSYTSPSYFRIYNVKAGDNAGSNADYAEWYKMVPFGAPYKDVNNNGVYDDGIDIPGMPNSAQTIFQVITDAYAARHSSSEGFGGGITNPLLKAEMHMAAWCYNVLKQEDIQYVKFEVINKNDSAWQKVYFAIIADPDLGDSYDDYIGCDTSRKLGFCYNADNVDVQYGAAPPAVGIKFLKGCYNRSVTPNVELGMTSFTFFGGSLSCETAPASNAIGAYNMLKGLKKDSAPYMNPTVTPYTQTKYCYSGDPETNLGWTETKGSIQNCGGTTGTFISPNPCGDRRFIIGSGADNFVIKPNEKQTILMCQLVARDANNLKSVTKLKNLSDTALRFYEANFPVGVNNISRTIPDKFELFQNYPNPFNPNTIIRYQIAKGSMVTLKIFDIAGREITTLVNEKLEAGTYDVTFDGDNLASGIYYYKITAGDFTGIKKMVLIK